MSESTRDSGAAATPGPWTREPQNNVFAVLDSRQRLVCSTSDASHHTPAGEREANARLIAAVPDLLEACRLCAELGGLAILEDAPAVLAARAALRKAGAA